MMLCKRAFVAVALGVLLASCSDSSSAPEDGASPRPDAGAPRPDGALPPDGPARDAIPPDGVSPDRAPTPDDAASPPGCPCGPDQLCTTAGTCVAKPSPQPGEIHGELILLRQVNPFADGVLAAIGKAEVLLKEWTPLPTDKRTHFATVDPGGDCAYEIDTNYPYSYEGQDWPAGLGLGAGLITFRPQGAPAPGRIEMEPLDMEPGVYYFHGDIPPPLKEGYGTHRDLFGIDNVPFGVPFTVELAGGADLPALTLGGGETAADFAVTNPPVGQAGATAPANAALKIAWSPPQPGATMEIFITQNWGVGGATLLTCTVPDDGDTTISATALGNFAGEVGVQLRRSVTRYELVQLAGGKTLHAYLIGRHARLGKLELTK